METCELYMVTTEWTGHATGHKTRTTRVMAVRTVSGFTLSHLLQFPDPIVVLFKLDGFYQIPEDMIGKPIDLSKIKKLMEAQNVV